MRLFELEQATGITGYVPNNCKVWNDDGSTNWRMDNGMAGSFRATIATAEL